MHLSSIHLAFAALVAVALGSVAPPSPRVESRDFFSLGCKGENDPASYSILERHCDDCFNIYKEPKVYTDCESNCFASKAFGECIPILHAEDRVPEFKAALIKVHGYLPENILDNE